MCSFYAFQRSMLEEPEDKDDDDLDEDDKECKWMS